MRAIYRVAWLLLLAGCPGRKDVPCQQDSDCDTSGGGVCTLAPTGNRWCAFPDPECPSGMRYSEIDVGDGLGGVCVEGIQYTLTVRSGGNGNGHIESEPTGLSCSGPTCTGKFPEGTLVRLIATPTSGRFLGWADDCRGPGECALTMDSNHNVGVLFGIPGESLWVKQFGSARGDSGNAIAIDNEDNLIVVGIFSETITTGGDTLTSAGGLDIHVLKLSSSTGGVLWSRRFGGTMTDSAEAVTVDQFNNIYITGSFLGTVDFGGGALQSAGPDAFVLKLNADGEFVWVRKLGGGGPDNSTAVTVVGDSVVVAGSYFDSMTVDSTTLTSAGSDDIFVLKMVAASGATTWVRSFGGTFRDTPSGVAIDGGGHVAVVGGFAGRVNFGGTDFVTTSSVDRDGFLLKLDAANGMHLFSKQFGGTNLDGGTAVAVDAEDNILLTGVFGGTASFGCTNTLTAENERDVLLVKYTQAGACVWAQSFGGTGMTPRESNDISVNAAGDVAIAGAFCGSIAFGGETFTSASACPTADIFAARFTAGGAHLNSIRAGGSGFERARGIAQSTDGRFFVTGGFLGFAEFGGEAFSSAGESDIFVVGLAPL